MRNYCLNVDEIAKILRWRECGEPVAYEELSLEIEEANAGLRGLFVLLCFSQGYWNERKPLLTRKKAELRCYMQ